MKTKYKFEFETEDEKEAKELTEFLVKLKDKYQIKICQEDDSPTEQTITTPDGEVKDLYETRERIRRGCGKWVQHDGSRDKCGAAPDWLCKNCRAKLGEIQNQLQSEGKQTNEQKIKNELHKGVVEQQGVTE